MGNCLFGGLGDMEDYLPTKVIKPDGGVLEVFSPVTAGSDEMKTFVGNCHVRSNSESLPMITPCGTSLDYNRRVLKRSYTNVFSRKTRHKEKKTRKRMRNKGDISWKVKLVINTEELLQILSEGGRTNELIESVRAVAKCGNVMASSIISSSSEMNYLSVVQEVWTLCRIFKRNVSSRKYTPDWRELAGGKRMKPQQSKYQEAYISFGDNESSSSTNNINVLERKENYERNVFQLRQTPHQHQPIPVDTTSTTTQVDNTVPHFSYDNMHNITYENWDELRSVVEFAYGPSSLS